MVAVSVAARHVESGAAMDTLLTGWGTSALDYAEMKAERERALASLTTFKKFNSPTFDGKAIDPWVVETLVDSIRKLFENLDTLE